MRFKKLVNSTRKQPASKNLPPSKEILLTIIEDCYVDTTNCGAGLWAVVFRGEVQIWDSTHSVKAFGSVPDATNPMIYTARMHIDFASS